MVNESDNISIESFLKPTVQFNENAFCRNLKVVHLRTPQNEKIN